MFAPPPAAALSRAEIHAKRAQLQAKRESTGASSIGSANDVTRTDSQSPKAEKKQRRPFSAGKHGVEEIREEDKERWKFKKTKSKGSIGSAITALGGGSPGPASPDLMPPPPVPGSGPITPTGGSLKGSDAGSLLSSTTREEAGLAVGPEKPLTPGERASLPRGPPPKRPSRPNELFLPPTASPSGSLRSMISPESVRSSSLATPPPSVAPPSIPGAYPVTAAPKPVPLASPLPPTTPPMSLPPPIPEKSPLRQQRGMQRYAQPAKAKDGSKPGPRRHVSDTVGLTTAMADMRMKDPIMVVEGEHSSLHLPRAPAGAASEAEQCEDDLTGSKDPRSESSAKETQSSSRHGTGSEENDVTSPTLPPSITGSSPIRVEKPPIKRQSAIVKKTGNAATIRAALLGLEAAQNVAAQTGSPDIQSSGMLPNATGVLYNAENPNVGIEIPSPTTFATRDLPPTPTSIVPTPTELYQSPRNSMRARTLSTGSVKRSPLSQITEVDVKVNSAPAPTADEVSPHRLTTIPEFRPLSENSPPASGTAPPVPVTTHIHLRGGSVVTVTPPELTAWQRSIYIQGPIKLPKPVILPKKNSVASMDAFQEAIDQVYQSALFMPRRRSNDAFVNDICDFFDDFGFDDMGGGTDLIMTDDVNLDEEDGMDVDETDGRGTDNERFSTPPPVIEISPVEKAVAADVAESMSKPASIVDTYIPPVETEETLRARGIARLSQHSNRRNSQFSSKRNSQYASRRNSQYSAYRRDSANTSRHGSSSGSSHARNSTILDSEVGLPLLPAPEESMLDAVLEASHDADQESEEVMVEGDAGGMDWDDDDVQETDSSAPWTSPAKAMAYKKHALNRGLTGKEKKNPINKMRRLVATATTIL